MKHMRKKVSINDGWKFTKTGGGNPAELAGEWSSVTLPHTWNSEDGQDGGSDYYRGECQYTRILERPVLQSGERVYLEFEAAAMKAEVCLNGKKAGSHEGGYSTFRFDITDYLTKEENVLCVTVDNREYSHIYPQMADFTFYGGLYRPVSVILVPETHFDLDYWGASGISYSTKLADGQAVITAHACVTAAQPGDSVLFSIADAAGNTVTEGVVPARKDSELQLLIQEPHLWQGVKDPYLYTVTAKLLRKNEQIDEVAGKMGIREFFVDPEKGFFLNGIETPLRGVSRHQDWLGIGNALTPEHHLKDAELIREIGANTIRLAHYQHSQDFYDACDALGFIVWAEIPFISRMSSDPEAHKNCESQMRELVYQNYNHPSICFWGISNEITIGGDSPALHENLRKLNDLVHEADSTRLTVMAHISMLDQENDQVYLTDVMSYNHYFGWYGGKLDGTAKWLDAFHEKHPDRPVGISEYGAEANITYHSDDPKCKDYSEEYQALYHECLAETIAARPYIWATHVWNMFDFGCDAREEGGIRGRNNKGLVTMDRKIKKDAFYLYKAYWSSEPFVHICGRRYAQRTGSSISVKVYSNLDQVTLMVDGKSIETKSGDKIFLFENAPFGEGYHFISAAAGKYRDSITLEGVLEPNPTYVLIDEEAEEGEGVANWFTNLILEEKDEMEFQDGYYSVRDTIEELFSNEEAANAVVGAMYSSSGMKFKRSMLHMMGKMSLLDIQAMADKASGGDVTERPPMKAMMKRLNTLLQTIRK